MTTLNYAKRLDNLRARKFDPTLNESVLSKSFDFESIPQNIKYLVESMRPIDQKYNSRTLEAADRVQAHLEKNLDLHFGRAYRTQGSVKTATNIKVHSDFDLLAVIDRYYYPGPGNNTGILYTGSNADVDIHDLRAQSTSIMRRTYDKVDETGEKSISIFNKDLNRKVDIVFCYWYNTLDFENTKDEYYRGVYLYKFPSKTRVLDFPFATIYAVNLKGDYTADGSRAGIRLLKNLRADSDEKIDLTSFQLTSIVHSIENGQLSYSRGLELKIATAMSNEMKVLIESPAYRKGIVGPNGTEHPLSDDSVVPQIRKLKIDLDTLISDCSKELYGSDVLRKAVINY